MNSKGIGLLGTGLHVLEPNKAFKLSSADIERYGRLASASDALLRAYEEIFAQLGAVRAVDSYHAAGVLEPGADLRPSSAITGVAIGLPPPRSSGHLEPGGAYLHIYTTKPMTSGAVVQNIRGSMGISAFSALETVPVVAVHTGVIDAYQRTRWSPVVAGVSIGHPQVTAGTLGAFATGRQAPRDENLLVLSNNHVLAAVNEGKPGDPILQPGVLDSGVLPADQLGGLEQFVPIDFFGDNVVDAATAWIEPLNTRRETLYHGTNGASFYRTGTTPVMPTVGLIVGKSGRTTGLTAGYVSAIGARIRVDFGRGRQAWFVDQIAINGRDGHFSDGGDSGSLVWDWRNKSPLGLIFAGGGGVSFANPIGRVLDLLDIRLI